MTPAGTSSGSRRRVPDNQVRVTLRRALVLMIAFSACPGPGPQPVDAGDGLPCDVANFVSVKCLSCHGSPLTNSAPMPLRTREDFLSPSPLDAQESIAERCVARMQMTGAPMPPLSWPVVTDAER